MNKTALLLVYLFIAATSAMIFASCKKDSNSSHTPSASIKDTSQTVNEAVGTVNVIVNLDQAASQALKLNFALTGTAVLNGDYEVDSASSISIPSGGTTATLKFTILMMPFWNQIKQSTLNFRAPEVSILAIPMLL